MTLGAVRSGAPRPKIEPGDVAPEAAARRMGLALTEFERHLPTLYARGLPAPDLTTGLFDLEAIDAWRRRRNAHLFHERLTAQPEPRDADVVRGRLERMRGG